MGALAVLPLSGLRSHGGHQPAPPGLVKGVKPEVRPSLFSMFAVLDAA